MSDFINLDQAAQRLNVTRATMYKLVRDKKLRAYKPGGRLQFNIADVDAYMQKVCTMHVDPEDDGFRAPVTQ